jgi:hypothetical protein
MTNVAELQTTNGAQELVWTWPGTASTSLESVLIENHRTLDNRHQAGSYRVALGAADEHPLYLVLSSLEATKDDPMVVSDDDPRRHVQGERLRRMNALHSYFAPKVNDTGLTECLSIDRDDKRRSLAEKYSIFWNYSFDGAAKGAQLLAFAALPAAISFANWRNAKRAAITDCEPTKYSVFQAVARQKSLMNKYLSILTPVFLEKGYTATETYRDGLGGLIVDFLLSDSRICMALTDKELQFIFFEGGEMRAETFEQPEKKLLSVLEFAQSRFA